jgi:sRNA-binding protein
MENSKVNLKQAFYQIAQSWLSWKTLKDIMRRVTMSNNYNTIILEQLFEECLEKGMTEKQAEVEAQKIFEEKYD